jgi:hypothetical protein
LNIFRLIILMLMHLISKEGQDTPALISVNLAVVFK